MVESIKNTMNRVDVPRNRQGDTATASRTPVSAAAGSIPTASVDNSVDTPKVVAQLAESPPVNTEAVARIKAAIAQGKYPIDVDQITDALMDAYRELKS
ncbi:flagellar biosynthesis anti-sigma factor FlgM [Alphaproteobacteria bacterium LSUCC0684]